MRDSDDTKLRELAYRLAQMAPDAPPFPEEPMVQLRPSPTSQPTPSRRWSPLVLAGVAALVVMLLVGGPLLLDRLTSDRGGGSDDDAAAHHGDGAADHRADVDDRDAPSPPCRRT